MEAEDRIMARIPQDNESRADVQPDQHSLLEHQCQMSFIIALGPNYDCRSTPQRIPAAIDVSHEDVSED